MPCSNTPERKVLHLDHPKTYRQNAATKREQRVLAIIIIIIIISLSPVGMQRMAITTTAQCLTLRKSKHDNPSLGMTPAKRRPANTPKKQIGRDSHVLKVNVVSVQTSGNDSNAGGRYDGCILLFVTVFREGKPRDPCNPPSLHCHHRIGHFAIGTKFGQECQVN
jgi:hypothetical protein